MSILLSIVRTQNLISKTVSEFLQEPSSSPLFSPTPCKKDMQYYSLQSFPISIYSMATGTAVMVKNKSAMQKDWPEVGNGL